MSFEIEDELGSRYRLDELDERRPVEVTPSDAKPQHNLDALAVPAGTRDDRRGPTGPG